MPRGLNPYDEAQLQRRLWTPDLLVAQSNLSVWFDANDTGTITIATGVSSWRNKSRNGNNATQGTASLQPAFSRTSFFGRPGITTDGVDDNMTFAATFGVGNTTHAVYILCSTTGTGSGDGYRPILGVQPVNGTSDAGTLIYRNISGGYASYPYYNNPSPFFFDSGPSFPINTPLILGFQSAGSGWGVYENSTLRGTTNGIASPSSTVGGYRLGAQNNPARHTQVMYAEIIGVAVATTQTRLVVEGYMAHKWGMNARLPATHPFRNDPPLIGD
jgi:hypothetical protein